MVATQTVRAGAYCALAGAVTLIGMAVVGLSAGEGMAIVGQPGSPETYAASLEPYTDTLQIVMALDNLFLIAYTGAFIGAAALVWGRARLLGIIGLGLALLLALLDISENAVTIQIARSVESSLPVSATEITLLGLLEQIKYATATLAVVYFAIAILIAQPASRFLTVGVSALFLLFPLVNAVTVVNPAADILLILWMLLMLLGTSILLWRSAQLH